MSEIIYCANPKCNHTWIVEREFDDFGREAQVCETCTKAGFTIQSTWGRYNLLQDNNPVAIFTKCLANKKPQPFVPYDHESQCANKDCHNKWSVHLTEPLPILICGGHAKVCASCTDAGYTVYDGRGDGKFYLSKHGKQVDVYDYKTAYKIVEEENCVF